MTTSSTSLLGTALALIATACAVIAAVVDLPLPLRITLIVAAGIALAGAAGFIGVAIARLRAERIAAG